MLAGAVAAAGRRRASGASSWTPADLSPEFWIRGDLGHSFADSDPITAITNQGSSSNLNLTQGTSSLQGTFDEVQANANGQSVFAYDGTENIYGGTSGWPMSDGDSFTRVIVFGATGGAEKTIAGTRQYDTRGGMRIACNTTAASPVFEVVDSGAAAAMSATDSTETTPTNTLQVYAMLYTGAVSTSTDTLDARSGGSSLDEIDPPTDMGAVASSLAREWIIAASSISSGSFRGWIAEDIFVKRAITSGEDASLTAYLNDRYGLSLTGVTQ